MRDLVVIGHLYKIDLTIFITLHMFIPISLTVSVDDGKTA